eukprot:485754-Rhodomonas_salina.1
MPPDMTVGPQPVLSFLPASFLSFAVVAAFAFLLASPASVDCSCVRERGAGGGSFAARCGRLRAERTGEAERRRGEQGQGRRVLAARQVPVRAQPRLREDRRPQRRREAPPPAAGGTCGPALRLLACSFPRRLLACSLSRRVTRSPAPTRSRLARFTTCLRGPHPSSSVFTVRSSSGLRDR